MKIIPFRKIENLINAIENATQLGFQRPTWIRFNLDCLAFSQGGGPNSWATGLDVKNVIEALEWWVRQTMINGFTIGTPEVAADRLAVKSAAQISSTLVHAQTNRRIVNSAHTKVGRSNW
jgi:hypothetical protein